MSSTKIQRSSYSRRQFLRFSAVSGGVLALTACGAPQQAAAPAPPPTAAPAPTEAPSPVPTVADAAAEAEAAGDVEVMAKDVIEYLLESDDWEGGYGSVKFKIHEANYNGEPAYFIRTDGSDPDFAAEEGLVFVPLLNVAANMENRNILCNFEDGRAPIIKYAPGDDDFSSLFQIVNVVVKDDSAELNSHADVMAAMEAGAIEAEMQNLFVNYPLVKWPDGELSVDSELKEVLPGGQLFEPVNTDDMTVTMKLHQCYPGSRYILTDTGAVPMAPMMNIPPAGPTNQLKDLNGTDEIWVFGNGIPGPGVMGFQPAIFDNKAGQPAWSPFWDHFTVTWVDEGAATLLKTSAEIRELIDSGALELWNGVPDSHPNGFVVNCPAPILAPNTFEA